MEGQEKVDPREYLADQCEKDLNDVRDIINNAKGEIIATSKKQPIYDDQLVCVDTTVPHLEMVSQVFSVGKYMVAISSAGFDDDNGFRVGVKKMGRDVDAEEYAYFLGEVKKMLEKSYEEKGVEKPENRKKPAFTGKVYGTNNYRNDFKAILE
jgi:hypothetical protein